MILPISRPQMSASPYGADRSAAGPSCDKGQGIIGGVRADGRKVWARTKKREGKKERKKEKKMQSSPRQSSRPEMLREPTLITLFCCHVLGAV